MQASISAGWQKIKRIFQQKTSKFARSKKVVAPAGNPKWTNGENVINDSGAVISV